MTADQSALPPPTTSAPTYSLALVCLGNICRSPMAQLVLADKIERQGLGGIRVTSCGTGDWHVGERMDPRAAQTLVQAGYDPSHHRAQQFDLSWFDDHDALLVMDASNRDDVLALARHDSDRSKVQMFRAHDPEDDSVGQDVPDPYYGGPGGFDDVMSVIERTTAALVERLDGFAHSRTP